MNTYEPITIKRLDDFAEVSKELDFLLKKKAQLEQDSASLKAVNYSHDKVNSGNTSRNSQEEQYVLKLEKINKKISEYEAWLKPEKEIIKTQIARVKKWNYRKLLVYRYIEKMKWSDITAEFFSFEEDFELEKYGKYKDKILYWNRRALQELEKISSKPYVPLAKQLHL